VLLSTPNKPAKCPTFFYENTYSIFDRFFKAFRDIISFKFFHFLECPRCRRKHLAFVFQNYPEQTVTLGDSVDLHITEMTNGAAGVSHYPLGLTVLPDKCMRLLIGYHSKLFEPIQIERIKTSLIGILEAIATDVSQRVSTRGMVS